MIVVRSVLKAMKLPKSMWNAIEKEVIYIKNRIITSSESGEETITPFEDANDVFFNISNLRALNCRAYTHIFKTFNHQKLDDRCWKGIHVDYDKNNQWKIYNSRTRTVHLTKNVRFDKKNIFYDEENNASENFEDPTNKSEIEKLWSSENDSLLNVHSRRNWSNGSEEIQALMTSKSLSKDDNNDESMNESDETEKRENFADATDLQSSPLDLQSFFLFESAISKSVMPAPQQTQSMRKPLSNKQLQAAREEHTDELTNENAETASDTASVSESTVSSTNSSRKHDKDFAPTAADRSTRFKANKLSPIDYKKFNDSGKRSKERVNYLNDLYYIKHIPNSHNHMQRALNTLMTEENFELKHVSESFIYK